MIASDLRSEIAAHLREAKIDGLPKEWFTGSLPVVDALQEQTIDSLKVGEGDIVHTENSVVSAERVLPSSAPALSVKTPFPVWEQITEESVQELENLRSVTMACTKCRLCETRKNVVFGVGNIHRPLIAFIGEGPGADEDEQGVPFVGRSGQLLTAAITKGMGLRREDIYIANVVKCRPPENRAPLPDESGACLPYLYRQLELIQPRVLVTLGQPAQMALSGVNLGITKLRGQWQSWRGFKLMPTFHPAYLLRNPPAKRFFWEDLQSVMNELGLPKPQRDVAVEENSSKNPWPSS